MSANRSNEELDALAQRLRLLPEPLVSGDLEGRLLAAIPTPLPSEARARRRPRRVPSGALVAAAVMLAFFLGYLVGRADHVSDLPPPPPRVQTAEEQPPEVASPDRASPDFVSLSSSFEWPVSATLPASAHRLPEDLTD